VSEREYYSLEEALDLILGELIPEMESLKFDQNNWRELATYSNYSSILEMGYSILLLIQNDLGFHGYPLARGMLIAIADLKNLVREECYELDAEYSLEQRVFSQLKDAKKGNPYLAGIAALPKLDELIAEKKERVEELFEKGAREIPDEQKLKRAGMSNEYDGLYRAFSQHSHGATTALISRHVRPGEDESFKLVAFDHGKPDEFRAMTTTVFEFLQGAAEEIRTFRSSK